MRGLEIRLKFARGKLAASIFGEEFADEVWEALAEARALGDYDYQGRGFSDSPRLFKDEPVLLGAWRDGWGGWSVL